MKWKAKAREECEADKSMAVIRRRGGGRGGKEGGLSGNRTNKDVEKSEAIEVEYQAKELETYTQDVESTLYVL